MLFDEDASDFIQIPKGLVFIPKKPVLKTSPFKFHIEFYWNQQQIWLYRRTRMISSSECVLRWVLKGCLPAEATAETAIASTRSSGDQSPSQRLT